VRGDHDVAGQRVTVSAHAPELERARDGGDGTVSVGDEADLLGARTDAAEAANDSQRGRGTARAPARGAGDDDAHGVRGPARPGELRHLDGVEAGRAEGVGDEVTGDVRGVQEIEGREDGREAHRRIIASVSASRGEHLECPGAARCIQKATLTDQRLLLTSVSTCCR